MGAADEVEQPGVGDAGERCDLSTLTRPEARPDATDHDAQPGRRERRPDDIVGTRLCRLAPGRCGATPFDEGREPRRRRRLAVDGEHGTLVDLHHRCPRPAEHPAAMGHDRFEQVLAVGGADDDRRRLERIGAGVVRRTVDRADLLHVDAVDGPDLTDEQVDQRRVGELDGQFVDRTTRGPLEDVDADDLSPDGTDAARHLTQRTGTIGKPDTDDVGLHARTVRSGRERPVSGARTPAEDAVAVGSPDLPGGGASELTDRSSTLVRMARRLTPRGEQRRSELIEFATARFAANGYHPTSVAELVDGLGVGKGVFYWYFESKEELFIEILREGERALRRAQWDAMGDERDPIARLELGIRASMEWWSEHRDLYVLIEFARTEASFASGIRKGERVALEDTQKLVQEAMDDGAIPDGNAVVISQAVLGVSSVLARTQLLGRKRPPSEVADEVIDFCRHGLRGTGDIGSAKRSA